MPKIGEVVKPGPAVPYWSTTDGSRIRLYHGHVLEVLAALPPNSIQCICTSPPYWGLRDYGTAALAWPAVTYRPTSDAEPITVPAMTAHYGAEPTPAAYVGHTVLILREIRRVLRDDGTVWWNIGDSYTSSPPGNKTPRPDREWSDTMNPFGYGPDSAESGKMDTSKCLPSGNLVGIPWRVALALQADGWILRQDIVWCLSGGNWLYAKSKRGIRTVTVSALHSQKEPDVELWNGEKWTRLLGISKTPRTGEEIQLTLRSGERISCTATHRFPTVNRGLIEAGHLEIGDCLVRCRLPEPPEIRRPKHIGLDVAWLSGLYLAEGSGISSGNNFGLAGHAKETARWERVQQIVKNYGGSCKVIYDGNNQTIQVWSKVLCTLINEFVVGKIARNKAFSSDVWKYGDDFVESMMDGYLSGDGQWEAHNNCWKIGFTRNEGLERSIRTACARLGWVLRLKLSTTSFDGRTFKTCSGKIRKVRSGHRNEKCFEEVLKIERARSREIFDLGVEDEPHLFALASGILTHNSKPSPMPESVRNRCTKAHEYVFLLAKQQGYYCDMEAIKEGAEMKPQRRSLGTTDRSVSFPTADYNTGDRGVREDPEVDGNGYRNKRSVWTVSKPLLKLKDDLTDDQREYVMKELIRRGLL